MNNNWLIYEKLFGAKWYVNNGKRALYMPELGEQLCRLYGLTLATGSEPIDKREMKNISIPDYENDIASAFKIVEEMKSKGYALNMHYSPDRKPGFECRVKFVNAFQQSGGGDSHEPSFSDNPTTAICQAALAVLEGEND